MRFLPILLIFLIACNNVEKEESTLVKLPEAKAFDTTLDGKKVRLAILKNGKMQAAVTNYGARVVGLWVPKADSLIDVVLGFDNIHDYINAEERFFGAIVGRYGNRIAKGKFSLVGKTYQLDINNPPNTLHGGRKGFHSTVWDMQQPDDSTLVLTYVSADGEEGYPGELTVKVTYQLTSNLEFNIDYEVSANQKTVSNITNHNYWNLDGEGAGPIASHLLQVNADQYTPVDSTLIPSGIETVEGTAFDFRRARFIGDEIDTISNAQLRFGKGYDHNFVLTKGITEKPELAATVTGGRSGISMQILTTEPGLQFYGGNFMKSQHTMKSGSRDDFRTAFCLETQHFPDSPNQPGFPSTVLEPGAKYSSKTIHRFLLP
ncbi:MAG: galactose mutarotase [Chitinophagaceae bacterium]|nr:galactose mutarotase [Chitinophagaceae bacterium]